jgi:hypothetical protein
MLLFISDFTRYLYGEWKIRLDTGIQYPAFTGYPIPAFRIARYPAVRIYGKISIRCIPNIANLNLDQN